MMDFWKRLFILVSLLSMVAPVFAQGDAPAAAPSDAELPLAKLVYVAKFAKEPNWVADTFFDGALSWQPVDTGLSIISTDPAAPSRYIPGTAFLATNFYIEMTFTPVNCSSPESAIILNVRSNPAAENPTAASAYAFVMECDGTYRSRVVNDGESGLIDLMGDLPQSLTVGEPVSIGILLNRRSAIWYINGEEVGNYLISFPPNEGQIAIGAQLGMNAIVNDLRVWSLVENAETVTTQATESETESTPEPVAETNPPSEPAVATAADPLREWQQGRNIYVESFERPDNPLVFGWDDRLTGIRIGDLMVTTARDPLTVRYLADTPNTNTYPATYSEVIFQMRNCSEISGFGLALGEDDSAFTLIGVDCNGNYFARPFVNGEASADNFTAFIDPIEPFGLGHVIGAIIDGETVYAYFDSTLLGTFDLPNANQQNIGLGWISGGDPLTEVTIDNFAVVELLR